MKRAFGMVYFLGMLAEVVIRVPHEHGINDILIESLAAENAGLALYRQLLDLVRDRSVLLEEYARRMIAEEELHVGEVNKMLRKPGEITQFEA